MIVLLKDKNYSSPLKLFKLIFTSKFEISYDIPIVKGGKPYNPEKPPKSDDIEKLGTILAIKLTVENVTTTYELSASPDILLSWRDFLSTKIN